MQKKYAIAITLWVLTLIGTFITGRVYEAKTSLEFGGPGVNGFFGVYNSTTPTYYNNQSAAAALDSNGMILISPSTTLTIVGP